MIEDARSEVVCVSQEWLWRTLVPAFYGYIAVSAVLHRNMIIVFAVNVDKYDK